MNHRILPVITEFDRQLPYYLVAVGWDWNQEHVLNPYGYLYQWIQCVKGEGELITGGKTFRVKEGHAMLLFKGFPYEYYAISPIWITNWVVFDGLQVEPFLKHTAGIKNAGAYYLTDPNIFLSKVQRLIDVQQSDLTLKSLKCSAVIYSLLIDIIQYASINPNSSATTQHYKLKPLFNYIEENYNQPLTLEELSHVAGVSPPHLCTVFKKTTNMRIFQYINSVRIKKSKELLLQNPEMQIKDISLLVGFEDANYFCSVFKGLEQMSPSQFRKMYCNP